MSSPLRALTAAVRLGWPAVALVTTVLFEADATDMEQVQLDLTEIEGHLGIPPATP